MGATTTELGAIRIRVADAPAGLAVQVDGRVLSPPYEIGNLSPGPHKAMATAPGRQTWTGDIEVAAGNMSVVDVTLQPVTAPTAGRIRVVANAPEALVSIDDGPGYPAPFDGNAPGGHHKIVVTAPGYFRHTSSCEVSADVPCVIDARLAPMTDSKVIETTGREVLTIPRWAKWSLGIGLAAAVGVGAYLYLRPPKGGDTEPDDEGEDEDEEDDETRGNPGSKRRRHRRGRK
jgi:hypothetical protein